MIQFFLVYLRSVRFCSWECIQSNITGKNWFQSIIHGKHLSRNSLGWLSKFIAQRSRNFPRTRFGEQLYLMLHRDVLMENFVGTCVARSKLWSFDGFKE